MLGFAFLKVIVRRKIADRNVNELLIHIYFNFFFASAANFTEDREVGDHA